MTRRGDEIEIVCSRDHAPAVLETFSLLGNGEWLPDGGWEGWDASDDRWQMIVDDRAVSARHASAINEAVSGGARFHETHRFVCPICLEDLSLRAEHLFPVLTLLAQGGAGRIDLKRLRRVTTDTSTTGL